MKILDAMVSLQNLGSPNGFFTKMKLLISKFVCKKYGPNIT